MSALIIKILKQAQNLEISINNFPDLNRQLNKLEGFSLFRLLDAKYLEEFYITILPFLIINEDEIITGINSEGLLNLATFLFEENDTKTFINTGICLALVAVYSNKREERITAYRQLRDLFSTQSTLNNSEIWKQCNDMMTPIKIEGTFYPTYRIIWSWHLWEPEMVLDLERQRQRAARRLSIENALFLLGLSKDNLNKKQITEAAKICKTELRIAAGLSIEQSENHSLYNELCQRFDTSVERLNDYMDVINFDWGKRKAILDEAIDSITKEPFSQTDSYDRLLGLFQESHEEIQLLLRIKKKGQSYSVDEKLGKPVIVQGKELFFNELDFQDTIDAFWARVIKKLTSFSERYAALCHQRLSNFNSLDEIKELIQELKDALVILTKISKTGLIGNAARRAEQFNLMLSNLQNKIDTFEKEIKTSVAEIYELIDSETQIAADNMADMIRLTELTYPEFIKKIKTKLDWLNGLQNNELPVVEEEFKLHATRSLSVTSAREQLIAQHKAIEASQNALNIQLNDALKKVLDELLARYSQINDQMMEMTQGNDFIWQDKIADFQNSYKVWKNDCAMFLARIPNTYNKFDSLSPEIKQLIVEFKEKESLSVRKVTDFYKKTAVMSLDAFKYKALKNVLNIQIKNYLAKGLHHSDRMDSLERLGGIIDNLDNLQGEDRFLSLIQAIRRELRQTANSHEKIGFMGHLRECRLQKMYGAILKQEHKWNIPVPSMLLGEEDLSYLMLKKLFKEEESVYMEKETHHQDRLNSLLRLNNIISILDTDNQSAQERFDALLEAVKREKNETAKSHQRVGYFSRPCRLELVYAKIIDEASVFPRIMNTPLMDDEMYVDTVSFSND